MATRLTVALSVLAVLVFTTVALLLHSLLQDELTGARQRDLAGKVDIVRHFLEEARNEADQQALWHHLDDVLIGDGHMRIWLLGEGGAVLYGGRRRPEVVEGGAGAVQVRREDGLLMEGRRIALPAHPVIAASELIVAVDTREQQALLRRYRTAIATVCGLGLAATMLVAAWVTRCSLRPLQRLSSEAAALRPVPLSARLSAVETTELQLLVESFNRALDRVEAAYEQLAGFSADVAHELRTPLATMISATEVVLRRERSTGELRETLQLNLEVLREQSVLVNDMLFLAQADRGQGAGSLQATDLAGEAQHVAEYFEPLLDESRQQLRIEGRVSVYCNAALVRRALVNLVGNATRYTPPGGTITIALADGEGSVRIAVRNPGPPVPVELLPRLFERFSRADAARERGTGHHGLGLAIVRAVALMHGGRPFVQCAGGITEIGLEIPQHRDAAVVARLRAAAAPPC